VSEPGTAPAPFTHQQILLIFVGLMTGLLLAALDQTIVATALPTIVGELGGLDYYSWVVTAYLLSSTVSTPLYGKISDLKGRRATILAAIIIFLLGSLLAGLAQSMVQLILSRGVQGIGAGGLMATTFAVVGDIVAPRQRGRYIGYLAGAWAFASVLGPLIGGFIVDNVSWRWVFLINLPIGAVGLFVISSVLRLPVVRRPHRIDVEGAILLIGGVSSLLLTLVWGGTEYPWRSPVIIGLGTGGVVLTAGFAFWEARAVEPLIPLRLFRNPVFSVSSALGFLVGFALFGGVVFLPLFLQVVTGVSATSSGLLILPLTAGIVTGSVGSGRLTTSTGRYKVFPVVGMALATVGMYLLGGMTAETSQLAGSVYMVLMGLGVGMTMQVTLLAVQNAAEYRDLGVATSSAQFFRSMGGSFGVAIFGAIMNTRLLAELPARVPVEAVANVSGEVTRLLSSPAAIRALAPAVAAGIADSVELAIQAVFLSAVPIMIVGFILSLFLKEIPLRETIGPTPPVEGAGEFQDQQPVMVDHF
jgi:EmrB/QacA subfamily drug resistance transporter